VYNIETMKDRKLLIGITALALAASGGALAIKKSVLDNQVYKSTRVNERGGVTLTFEECQNGKKWLRKEDILSRQLRPNGEIGERRFRATSMTELGSDC
jgi:hypothetical protein